eukprot:2337135-Pleurochrysis_carterae.AAC.1
MSARVDAAHWSPRAITWAQQQIRTVKSDSESSQPDQQILRVCFSRFVVRTWVSTARCALSIARSNGNTALTSHTLVSRDR